MRILIVHDIFYPNIDGASYFTRRLAYYLKQRGHEVLVIAPSESWRSQRDELDGVPLYRAWSVPVFVGNYRFALPWVHNKKILQVVREFDPEVAHFQGHFPLNFAVLKACRELEVPTVGTNHFMPDNIIHHFHMQGMMNQTFRKVVWGYFLKMFNQLDVVSTPTQTAANVLKDIGYEKTVYPVSCGIDLERFDPEKGNFDLKEKYGLADKPTVIFVGRLDKDKNLDFVIRMLPLVLKELDMQLVIVGKGPDRNKLEKLAEKLDLGKNVVFTGFVPDEELPSLYPLANCAISSGTFELQSISTMEAMASGLPVVAVKALALPELVHEGENGYLYEPGNAEQAAQGLVKILKNRDLQAEFSQKSLEIIQKHEIGKILNTFEELHKKAIDFH